MAATYFDGCGDVNIGTLNINSHFSDDATLNKLHAHISDVAMHSSSARVDAPKCHEETREAVQQDVLSWSDSCVPGEGGGRGETDSSSIPEAPRASAAAKSGDEILWLTGPAGTGKTAIMGTVSDRLEKGGKLAATFYFSASRGAAGTTSKELFVTTLAYQLVVHPGLKDRLAPPMMAEIRGNPAVFQMSLERQLEMLILAPLRASQNTSGQAFPFPTSILVDGVDECASSSNGRSREENQLEVLSVILRATKDPAFPFRIIVASRPETWIRGYLNEAAAGEVHEIFLDEKYSPSDDIRLYLKAKFAEKRRRHKISSAWPREDEIDKLVENASGQFIYAATVQRWVDTPGTYPQAQLDAVLNLKVPAGPGSHPLSMLDVLYTSILKSSPHPDTTVLWLKAVSYIQEVHRASTMKPSAWTIDRLFESHEGQVQSTLGGVPSLVYKVKSQSIDLKAWGEKHGDSMLDGLSGPEHEASYAFYHKSFLDYLGDDSRCGDGFPQLTGAMVETWLAGKISQTLKSPGAGVAMSQAHLHTFQRCFLDLVTSIILFRPISLDSNALASCVPGLWLGVLEITPTLTWDRPGVLRALYILVHSDVSPPGHPMETTDRNPVPWGSSLYPGLQAVARGNLKAPKLAMEKLPSRIARLDEG